MHEASLNPKEVYEMSKEVGNVRKRDHRAALALWEALKDIFSISHGFRIVSVNLSKADRRAQNEAVGDVLCDAESDAAKKKRDEKTWFGAGK